MNENAEFDVIIYGASGFTGRLVAEYMAAQYGRTLNWAMAGAMATSWLLCAMRLAPARRHRLSLPMPTIPTRCAIWWHEQR